MSHRPLKDSDGFDASTSRQRPQWIRHPCFPERPIDQQLCLLRLAPRACRHWYPAQPVRRLYREMVGCPLLMTHPWNMIALNQVWLLVHPPAFFLVLFPVMLPLMCPASCQAPLPFLYRATNQMCFIVDPLASCQAPHPAFCRATNQLRVLVASGTTEKSEEAKAASGSTDDSLKAAAIAGLVVVPLLVGTVLFFFVIVTRSAKLPPLRTLSSGGTGPVI
jgi:hypothetical protein